MFTTLISAEQLRERLGSVVVVDCRFDLAKPEAGRAAYASAHLPGAIYAHLDEDLSGPKSTTTGRHPLPDPAVLARKLGGWGISKESQVIVYDADFGMYASRLWWLLRWVGHQAVAVLDGGFKGWTAAGFPTNSDAPSPIETTFVPTVVPEAVASTQEVAALASDPQWRLLDARAPERFRGDVEPIDPVAGHIPGARNHPFALNMSSEGRLRSAAELSAQLSKSLDGVAPERSIMMCGSGVTACHNLLALEIAGLKGAKLYAGSWSEWIRDPARPTAKGSL